MIPNCSPICIGSFPHKNAREITSSLLKTLKEFPMWPQLPATSFYESMYVQYSEGMPLAEVNETERTIFFKGFEEDDGSLEKFYENIENQNYDAFKISEKYAKGLYEFARLKDELILNRPIAVKGHITGPVSFALTVTDTSQKSLFFDSSLYEITTMALLMKAIWQINFLKNIYKDVVLFIDEPYLSGIGSGMLSIDPSAISEGLAEFITGIKAVHPDVKIAIHCCGNTDWANVLKTGIDILSFDAYNFGESLFYYEKELKTFIQKGGYIAWGVVPTSGDFTSLSAKDIAAKFDKLIDTAVQKGLAKTDLLKHSFLSPACGTGSLSEGDAEHILKVLSEISSLYHR